MKLESPADLHLTLLDAPVERSRWLRAGVGSLAAHVILGVVGLWIANLPSPLPRPRPKEPADPFRNATKLTAPITQPDANRAPLSKEFNVDSIAPRQAAPKLQTPGAPPKPIQQARSFTPPPPSFVPKVQSSSPVIQEAPTVDVAQTPLPLGNVPPQPGPPPKIAFEKPGAQTGTQSQTGMGALTAQKRLSIDEAVRDAARRPASGTVVGDLDDYDPSIARIPAPSTAGKLGSRLELLSDPMGVDFRPYLRQVLATIKRNWYAVIPESARMGRAGKTVLQFAIRRDGGVPKLVITMPSGFEPLDRAAVAGISASNPFQPLPPEFKGQQIALQLSFVYKVEK